MTSTPVPQHPNTPFLRSWLELIRLPNLLTVPGDVLAGWLLAHGLTRPPDLHTPAFVAAGVLLYAFGLIHNDIADLEEDRRERPDRPLPSGRIARGTAVTVAALLLMAGLSAAMLGGSLRVAVMLAAAIFFYNQAAKRDAIGGPLAMGGCRAINLLMGGSTAGVFPLRVWICAGVLMLWIAGVTALARNETTSRRIGPKTIGLLLSLLLPLQAAFCLASGAGRPAWICAGALLAIWPVHRLLARRFAPS